MLLCASLALSAAPPFVAGGPLFPEIPPRTDVDPADRHAVIYRVPDKLKVAWDGASLDVALADFKDLPLTVGRNMITGIRCEGVKLGGAKSSNIKMASEVKVVEPFEDLIPRGQVPTGENAFVEYTITIFETDVPAQHMWMPGSGKHYKVLWTHTFKEVIPAK